MDRKSSLNSSIISTNDVINITSKLRRLRIQEALLLQSIQKSGNNFKESVVLCDASNYKDLLKKARDSYINLKNLYDEVKANTQSQELLAELEIDEIKKKIFELETNINTFKSDIKSELINLKLAEQDLNKQVNENPNELEIVKRRPKPIVINYNAIVPSPVRVQMTCPFKYLEVQEFQEFMKNSSNRYGGWNEYNHNMFVRYWQKFFGQNYSAEFEDETFQESLAYEMFIETVIPKLPGVTTTAISSHVKWYTKFVFHKEKQQNAIDKWKWSKVTAKKVPQEVLQAKEEENILQRTITDDRNFIACTFKNSRYGIPEPIRDKKPKNKCYVARKKLNNKLSDRTQSILKPTKQWTNRSRHDADDIELSSGFQCIENMKKQLRTPVWRFGL